MKSRWGIYLKERFPIIPNLLVAGGITLSAKELAVSRGNEGITSLSIFLALLGGMLFLAQIRFMDEYKDFHKDQIAHPERPLPRGLFTVEEFGVWIKRFNFGMIALSVFAGVFLNLLAGVLFGFGTLYLYLMFKEFFAGEWLSKRPMLYAISHQLIIFPMGAFVYSCFASRYVMSADVFWFCTLLLGSFFAFEVGRKLDPNSHPILNTYLSIYGRNKTAFLLLTLLGISTHAGDQLHLNMILGPLYIVLILSISLIWWAPARFKAVEGLVILYLLIALWALPLKSLIMGSLGT